MGKVCRDHVSTCLDVDEQTLIVKMRVILALASLFTVMIDTDGLGQPHPLTMLVFYGYTAHSIVLHVLSQTGRAIQHPRLAHWLDVIWFSMVVAITGPLAGFFFLYFFVIATAAFRWGYDEGARVTLACTGFFLLSGLVSLDEKILANVLLRSAFLIGLGYMVAHWGEALLTNRRRIALLRDVSRLSNPRFGVDHTIASVLEHTRSFFDASACMALMRDSATGVWRLRSTGNNGTPSMVDQYLLDEQLAVALSCLSSRESAVYNAPPYQFTAWGESLRTRDEDSGKWQSIPVYMGRQLADLLGARSFVCTPIPLRDGEGRIFVISARAGLNQEDAAFLAQVAAQAFPVIENIALLDRMASDAGRRERKKFSCDLHDTTVQPYIGLSHALQALIRQAGKENPIAAELRQVADMADSFVRDLRRFATVTSAAPSSDEPGYRLALESHAAHFKVYHKLDIALSGHEALHINDRLGAELVQLVREGMSNIRRHTAARRGAVILHRNGGWLHIRIENECPTGPASPFTPRSISERAATLGGFAYVGSSQGKTTVHIDIPL